MLSFKLNLANFTELIKYLFWLFFLCKKTIKMPCHFQNKWLSDDSFKGWVRTSKSSTIAHCNSCKKDIDLGKMGESALNLHAKGKRHAELASANRAKPRSIAFFITPVIKLQGLYNVRKDPLIQAFVRLCPLIGFPVRSSPVRDICPL